MSGRFGGRAIGGLAGVALLAGAGTVSAEVTPEQVWADVQSFYNAFGATVTATTTTTTTGHDLHISGATGAVVLPADLGAFTMDLPDMVLTDIGDGTVGITMPAAFTGRVAGNLLIDEKVMDFSFDLALTTRDAVLTVSGQPGDMIYHSSVGLYDIAMDNLRATGLPDMEGVDLFAAMTIEGSDTTTRRVTTDTLATTEITSTSARTVIDLSLRPDLTSTSRSVTVIGASAATTTISIPATPIDLMNIAAALRAGLAFDLTTTTRDQTSETAVYLRDDMISVQTQTVAEARQQVSLSQAGLSVASSGSGIAFAVPQDVMLRTPVRVDADTASITLTLPVSAADAAQDFGLGFALRGVTLSDDLWNMFDASGTLPRDPATLDLEIAGQANLSVDLFDFNTLTGPAMMDRMARGETPVEVLALSLPRLLVNGAGIALTGTGSFAIDNSDLVTFDGLPKPVGKATFEITGANGLIDDLISLGLIGPDEAMGARMGMALVGRATGDDAMTSVIEINAAGHVIVNGQRMQ